MNHTILQGKDGRRWIVFESSGRAVEITAREPPPPQKPSRAVGSLRRRPLTDG